MRFGSPLPLSAPSPPPAPSTTRFPSFRLPNASTARSRSHSSTSGLRLGRGRPRSSLSSLSSLSALQATLLRCTDRALSLYAQLTPHQRAAALLAALVLCACAVLALLYTEAFFAWLATISKTWRQLPAGWLINMLLIMATSVPPIIGYSTANTIAGFVYGFPAGWPIAAAASIVGSLLAFLACRTVLSNHVQRLVGDDHRFVALGQVLRQDGLLYLTAIRFCPLPFSLSNGFLATIPSITPTAFALSTAISTPKLLIHVFIGSQMAILAEKGDSMSLRDRLVNYASIALGGSVGALVGYIIYRRTFARAAELAQEAQAQALADDADADVEAGNRRGFDEYAEDATLMDPEDAADIMGDDDVSLWNTRMEDDEGGNEGGGGKRVR